MKKKLIALALLVGLLVSVTGCFGGPQMPINGDITFHNIKLNIPERFVRDSTQSTQEMWLYECNNYKEYILMTYSKSTKDVETTLGEYIAYMKENKVDSQMVTFLGQDAVLSKYEMNGVFCQEICFPHQDAFYAVALRGGTEESFKELMDTIERVEDAK